MKKHHAHEPNKQLLDRLTRIEGQVRGIARMVEDQRYCIDVLTQMQAVKAAFRKVEEQLLKDHTARCVADAIKSGSAKEQTEKFNELVELFGRYGN